MSAAAPKHRDWTSAIAIVAGLFWVIAHQNGGWYACAILPGLLLVTTGTAALLFPGENKITAYMALGGALGVLLTLPAMFAGGVFDGLVAGLLSAAGFLLAGRNALTLTPETPGAPPPPKDLKTYAKAALDEALIGYFVTVAKLPHGAVAERMCEDAVKLDKVLTERGWYDNVSSYHQTPTAPTDARLIRAKGVGREYQRLRFSSNFIPDAQLPGAELWSGYAANRECNANLFQHGERGRPWLLCIHGYRMGMPMMDLRLFPPHILHDRFGLNLLMPTLPLHGPRRVGRQSGDQFLDGDLLDLLHAESQALWDLRRSIAWIRAQEPDAKIGVLGYSLGGYNAALLAAHEPGLEFVVAGIPVCDFANTLWRHIPPLQRDYFVTQGLDLNRYRRLLHVVSPEALPPKLPGSRLHIFAGTADRVVPTEQPLRLAKHWGRTISWFPGAHLTFRGERSVTACIEDAMTGAGWLLRPAA